jgi:hypothetical protein
MKTQTFGKSIKVWLSANDTYKWAHKDGAYWPCSQLSGHRVFVEFYSGNLVDITIDGKSNIDCDATEFNAIMEDVISAIEVDEQEKERKEKETKE